MQLGVATRNRLRTLGSSLLVTLVAVIMVASPAVAQSPTTTPGVPPEQQTPEWARNLPQQGVVAVAQPHAARAGAEMLAKGGNAIDAAAAIQFTLNVEEPMATGIGGGAFIMIYLKDRNEVVVLDSREMAPARARPDQFMVNGQEMKFEDAESHGNAVGVPGTLMGTKTALDRYGTMKLADVMQPAIKLAEEGFPVPAYIVQELPDYSWKLSKAPGKATTFFRPDGTTTLQTGDMLVQPDLAKTLRMIADQGIDVYYKGPIGQAVADIVKARGGPMEASDIASYQVKDRVPTRGAYRGFQIVSMPPPSSGGLTMLQMLGMLERFDIKGMGHNSADTLHAMIEAMHLAYSDRGRYMGDIDFVPVPQRGLLHPTYIAQRSAMIDLARANASVQAGDPWAFEGASATSEMVAALPDRPDGHTTHFSVADRWGNVVAWTTTIEDWYGSGIMVPGYGFLLNNEMTDFSFTPGVANELQPFKRPRSSMTPTILLQNGRPWMAVGSPGGSTIITTTMQAIMNVVDHGMSVQDAVNAPRIFSSQYPAVTWEAGIAPEVRAELASRGHQFAASPTKIGSVQSVIVDLRSGQMYGAGDPRRGGTAIRVAVARDGRTLGSESAAIVSSFLSVWGDRAYERWAYEHNQTLGR